MGNRGRLRKKNTLKESLEGDYSGGRKREKTSKSRAIGGGLVFTAEVLKLSGYWKYTTMIET